MFRDTASQDRVLEAPPFWVTWRKPLISAAVLLVLLVLALPAIMRWASADAAVPAERLRIAEVRRGDLVRDVSVQGRVVAANSPTLYAPSAGTVTLAVEAGQSVTRGQTLAHIDNPQLESQLAQERARLQAAETDLGRQRIDSRKKQLANTRTVDEARITLRAAERDAERTRMAYERGAYSEIEFKRAEDAVATAKIRLSHAEADAKLEAEGLAFEQHNRELALEQQQLAVAELERQVELLAITSPLDGQVGSVAVLQKAKVAADQAVMTVVDLTQLEVEISIPETLADDLQPGMRAELRMGTATYAGVLRQVSPEIIEGQVSGRVALDGDTPAELRQNQRLSGRIFLDQRPDVLLVERGPFIDNEGGRFAYVVRDGVAHRQPIQIGATSVGEVEITEGLDAGDRIVVAGTDRFAAADRVLIAN